MHMEPSPEEIIYQVIKTCLKLKRIKTLQSVFSNFNGMKLENHNKMTDRNLKFSQTYRS